MSSEDYVKQAVSDVETELQKVDKCLPTRVGTPLSSVLLYQTLGLIN